jgi:hypothetical protein
LDSRELEKSWRDLGEADARTIKETQGEDYELFRMIRAAQYRREPYLLQQTLRAISTGSVVLSGIGAVDLRNGNEDTEGFGGLCLNREVEEAMSRDGTL